MKKHLFLSVFAVAAALAVVFSCSKSGNAPAGENLKPAEVTAPGVINATISDLLAKVAFDPSYDANAKPESMSLTWATGDAIRVYDHADRSKYSDFAVDPSCIGQKAGVFSGDPISAASYDVEIINGAFDYAAQTQPSDGVATDLKYLASVSGIADYSSIVFTDFSSVLALTVQMPSTEVAAKIKSVDITASEDIFAGGNSLTITLDSVGDADTDGVLHLFATLPQGDQAVPAGTTLLVHFNAPGETHDVYTRFLELPASTFTANKVNNLKFSAYKSDVHAGNHTDDGSAAHPYLIGDKYQVAAINSLAVKGATTYFKMIDDVDMTGVTHTPINDDGKTDPTYNREVNFDGNNKTISKLGKNFFYVFKGSIRNLTLDQSSVTSRGIFAEYCQGTGHTITNVDISGSSMASTSKNSGALIGCINSGSGTTVTIKDCDITNTTVSGAAATGGFIGIIQAQVKIDDCTTAATVSGSDNNVGGFIGNFAAAGTITGCSATGNVTNTGSGKQSLGGFVGNMNSAGDREIAKCYATGNYTTTGAGAGGFVGKIEGSQTSKYSIHDCYATGNWAGSNVHYVGGFVGQIQKSAGTVTFTNCYGSGTVYVGYGYRHGGFAGGIDAAITTIQKCAGWSSQVKGQTGVANWSAGAVVGVAFPICTLTDNYRKPGMTLYAYWGTSGQTKTLTDSFQHENVSSTSPLWTYDSTGTFVQTTKTSLDYSDGSAIFAYQGKCDATKTLSQLASTTLGWSSSIWDFTADLPTLK